MRKAKICLLRTEKPFDGLFPSSKDVLDSITLDMKARGFDDAFPIIAWNGVVVDGHTRLQAATDIGCDVVVSDKEFASVKEALSYAVHCQKDRRNLTNAGIMAAIRAIEDEEKVEAEKRMKTGKTLAPLGARVEAGRSDEKIAKTLGIGSRTVDRVRAIDKGPEEIKGKVEAGEMSIGKGAELSVKARKGDDVIVVEQEHLFIRKMKKAMEMGERAVMEGSIGSTEIVRIDEFIVRLKSIKLQANMGGN